MHIGKVSIFLSDRKVKNLQINAYGAFGCYIKHSQRTRWTTDSRKREKFKAVVHAITIEGRQHVKQSRTDSVYLGTKICNIIVMINGFFHSPNIIAPVRRI